MKKRAFVIAATAVATTLALPLAGCRGSSTTANQAEQVVAARGPQTKISNTTDADVAFVSLDEGGITLSLSVSELNLLFMPKSFVVEGNTYDVFDAEGEPNPQVHILVDGSSEDTTVIDIKEGESHEVRISIDGVSDYSRFQMVANNTIYDDSGKSRMVEVVAEEPEE